MTLLPSNMKAMLPAPKCPFGLCPLLTVIVAAHLFLVATAQASPWTLKQGQLVLKTGYDFQFAEDEFLDDGPSQSFPLDGSLSISTISVGLRAGFTDKLEFELDVPFRIVSYTSDPVILLQPQPGSTESDFDFYQRNVIDLARTVAGVGDLTFTGRYGFLRFPVALAAEIKLKAPTGYDSPAGTFGERPTSREQFLQESARFVSPENVEDDVTLGDGQLDITGSLLLGYIFPTRTFIRTSAGYNLRLGDAGDQFVGEFKVGQAIGQQVLAFAGVDGGYTLFSGRRIGISVAAIDPNLPATEYDGTENLLLREVTLDRDFFNVGGGFIVRLSPRLEVNTNYQYTLFGRNTSAIHRIGIGLAFKTDFGFKRR